MTLLIPFLPVYVRQLGVSDDAGVLFWSGVAYAATFLTAALTAPLWGSLGDRYGRKSMLIRASLGMSVAMSLIGLAQSVWQLVVLRLLVGLLGGYSSASTILVAADSPVERRGWGLGVLSSGIMAGSIVGPLLGGLLPQVIGIRLTFLLTGALIFLAFLATALLVTEDRPRAAGLALTRAGDADGPRARDLRGRGIGVLLLTGSMVMFATMSVEPLVTEYVALLDGAAHATVWAGVVMSLGALGAIVSAPFVGRLADRHGPRRVIVGCLLAAAACLVVQGLVDGVGQLAAARLLMGVSLGGLMPAVTAALRACAPPGRVGRLLGWSVSAQYVGDVTGPVLGGLAAGVLGMRSVFAATAVVLLAAALLHAVPAMRVRTASARV
ncbi:MFS transporter [Nocardioides gansuensis]|uniref:MFS transporter n=2 Tax=Nocardioides gansuensis TaxID=2138300 RepID=A0A2T8FEC6_9ACTN|nr:MFS transporter [Nocardioides gansuensis]